MVSLFTVLGMEPRASLVLGKRSPLSTRKLFPPGVSSFALREGVSGGFDLQLMLSVVVSFSFLCICQPFECLISEMAGQALAHLWDYFFLRNGFVIPHQRCSLQALLHCVRVGYSFIH